MNPHVVPGDASAPPHVQLSIYRRLKAQLAHDRNWMTVYALVALPFLAFLGFVALGVTLAED